MKKLFTWVASLILVVVAANAQDEKKEPPPPPPKPKEEKIKTQPPKMVKVGGERPAPPNVIKEEETKEPPVITVKGKLADEFYTRNPTVSDISRQGNIITIKKKDGTTEKYDMSKKEEDKGFTGKYGNSPIPPPPPPPKIIVKKQEHSHQTIKNLRD